MVKKIKKKKKQLEDPLDEVVQKTDIEDEGTQSPLRNSDIGFAAPHRDSPVKLTFKATGSFGCWINV